MIHPVICNPVLNPLVGVLNPVGWRAGKAPYPDLPALAAGEFFLDDEDGKYLTDDDGKYLIGEEV